MDFLTLLLLIVVVVVLGFVYLCRLSFKEDYKFVKNNMEDIIREMGDYHIELIPIEKNKYQFSCNGKLTKVLTEKQFVKAIVNMQYNHYSYVLGPLYPQEFKMVKHPFR